VARVERLVAVPRPSCRITHIADFHAVALDDLTTDLRDQDPEVTDADIEAEYQAVLATVRPVQANQCCSFAGWRRNTTSGSCTSKG